jgi:hypothetical protein
MTRQAPQKMSLDAQRGLISMDLNVVFSLGS